MKFKGIKLSLWLGYFLTKISKKEFIPGLSQLPVASASCVFRQHLSNDSFHHHGTLSHPFYFSSRIVKNKILHGTKRN